MPNNRAGTEYAGVTLFGLVTIAAYLAIVGLGIGYLLTACLLMFLGGNQ